MEKSAGKLRKHFDEITNRALLWLLSKSEAARFDGIIICDPEESEQFRTTIIAALQLVKDTDQRRFERITPQVDFEMHA